MNCFLPCSTQSKCYQALYDLGPSYLSHLISYHSLLSSFTIVTPDSYTPGG